MTFKRFVGIDIGKSMIDVAVLTIDSRQTITHAKFKNLKADFHKMKKWVEEVSNEQWSETIFFLEHTGLYSIPICLFFEDSGFTYSLESPLQIARSLGIKRGKTDKADAIMLVKYAYLHREELAPNRIPHKGLLKLRTLLGLRDRFIKAKMMLSTPARELSIIVEKEIHNLTTQQTNGFVIEVNNRIKKVEQQITELIESEEFLSSTYKLITSVPCIGPVTAAYLMVYTKCFNAFEDSRKFACYAGLAPFEHTSGTSIKGKTRVSYIANRHIKSLLTTCALLASRHDKELSRYFDRKLSEGKNKMSVINAIRNKLISRVFAVAKRGTPFVKSVDIAMA